MKIGQMACFSEQSNFCLQASVELYTEFSVTISIIAKVSFGAFCVFCFRMCIYHNPHKPFYTRLFLCSGHVGVMQVSCRCGSATLPLLVARLPQVPRKETEVCDPERGAFRPVNLKLDYICNGKNLPVAFIVAFFLPLLQSKLKWIFLME